MTGCLHCRHIAADVCDTMVADGDKMVYLALHAL